MAEEQDQGAVGLAEAAAIAGVSVATLRRWANEGRLPSYRTPGGHRRFRVADVQRALTAEPTAATDVEEFGSLASSRIRRQIAAHRTRDLDWLAGLDGAARDRLRLLGRHLLATVEDYLARRRPRAAVLAEARQFGLMYGRELASLGFTVRQAIEAFTFFRRGIEDTARRYVAQHEISVVDADDLRDQLHALADRVLFGIAESYERLPHPGSESHDPSSEPTDRTRNAEPGSRT